MKEAMHGGEPVVAVQQDETRKRRSRACCSVCTSRIWFDSIRVVEPEGVPEPRLSWILCKQCNNALMNELNHSPLQSPLRLRIAIGLVAAERWPYAYVYTTRVREYVSDRRWIVFMTVAFITAMILHLVLFVIIGGGMR